MSNAELLLIGAAFLGGLVDSIAGGGGMITIPAMVMAGLPPHFALGTNKLQSFVGSFTASCNYWKKGLFSISDLRWAIILTALGAMSGTFVVQMISGSFLKNLIIVLLILIFLYMIFCPRVGNSSRQERVTAHFFYPVAGFLLGFYDGFFGPGTGSFWAIALVFFLGQNLRKATAHTKMMNFISNVVALLVFIFYGKVAFKMGIMMWPGQILGAWLGSKLVIRYDTRFIRYVLLLMTGITIVVLTFRRN